jgi:DHA1 family tetracycline resistance protein-like MFS transporter
VTTPVPDRRALLFIFLTVFLDLLGVGILVPVIPFLIGEYSARGLTVGLVALTFSGAQFLAAPLLGRLSDRWGRRPVLVLSVLGSGLGYVLFALGGALWVYFLARLIDGITGGNISAAQAYIADVSPPEHRVQNFGLLGAAFGLGFLLGPAVGGVLSHYSLHAPAWGAAGLALATALFGLFVLQESLPADHRRGTPILWRELDPFGAILRFVRRPALTPYLLAMTTLGIAFAGFRTNLAVFTRDHFLMGPERNAVLFTIAGFFAVFTQGVIVRRLTGHLPPKRSAFIGCAVMGCGLLGIGMTPVPWGLYPAVALIAIGSGLANPSLTALLSTEVSPAEQGTLFGATQGLQSFTMILGPVLAGLLYDAIGQRAPYLLGAGLLSVSVVALRTARHPVGA